MYVALHVHTLLAGCIQPCNVRSNKLYAMEQQCLLDTLLPIESNWYNSYKGWTIFWSFCNGGQASEMTSWLRGHQDDFWLSWWWLEETFLSLKLNIEERKGIWPYEELGNIQKRKCMVFRPKKVLRLPSILSLTILSWRLNNAMDPFLPGYMAQDGK
jgi:hypothetical protein